jgi:hypothetical protein
MWRKTVADKKKRRNDDERRLWVLYDEGLYRMFKSQCLRTRSVRQFVRDNREQIDEVIDAVESGKKPAHYLAYGG